MRKHALCGRDAALSRKLSGVGAAWPTLPYGDGVSAARSLMLISDVSVR